jgi:hypothetical protein
MSHAPGGSALRSLARLIPAAFAAFELRYLLASMAKAAGGLEWAAGRFSTHPASLWLVLLLALGACLMLRETGRGLVGHASRPGWSVTLLYRWLLCSSVLVALFCCALVMHAPATGGDHVGLADAMFGPAGWSSVPAALCVGFLLATSLQRAWRVLCEVPRLWAGQISGRRQRVVAARMGVVLALPAAGPLLAGWSDRGPPVDLPLRLSR